MQSPKILRMVHTTLPYSTTNLPLLVIRQLACDILLVLVEAHAGYFRKLPEYSTSLLQLGFSFMLTTEDIPIDEWTTEVINIILFA